MPNPTETSAEFAKRIHRDAHNARATALTKAQTSSMPLADRLALTSELSKLQGIAALECPRDRLSRKSWVTQQRELWLNHYRATDSLQREFSEEDAFVMWMANEIR